MKPFVHIGDYEGFIAAGIDQTKPVHVYRNLHRKCWSVRQFGVVKAHCEYIELYDCDLVVQPAGREKVIRENKKNVHAYIKGRISTVQRALNFPDKLSYNPHECGSFIKNKSEECAKVNKAWRVSLTCKGATSLG